MVFPFCLLQNFSTLLVIKRFTEEALNTTSEILIANRFIHAFFYTSNLTLLFKQNITLQT